MATVWVPTLLVPLCGGEQHVQVPGATVRAVIDALETRCPGIRDRLISGDALDPTIAVSVDGELGLRGLDEPVGDTSEVFFLPPLVGG